VDRRPAFPPDFELILASQSPRRHSLLRDVGIPFTVASSDAQEVLDGRDHQAIAEQNAEAKLLGVALADGPPGGAFVLATDTIVAVDDWVLGKASDESEAAAMLRSLSGRTHQVVSGVALGRLVPQLPANGPEGASRMPQFSQSLIRCAVTDVTFDALEEEDIQAYVASGDWRGKAGAYAIQGLAGIYSPRIHGEYSNVVGLPLHLLASMFRTMGFDLVRRQWL
jgi:septum formation protein